MIPRSMWPEAYRNQPDYPPSSIGWDGQTLERSEPEVFTLTGLKPIRDLGVFWVACSEWQQATFGTDAVRGPEGTLKHLAKETVEAAEKPYDILEYADLLLLLVDATRRAGFTYDQLVEAGWDKLAINKQRSWPKPEVGKPVEHIK